MKNLQKKPASPLQWKSTRVRKPVERYDPSAHLSIKETLGEPTTYKEAISGPYLDNWYKAMQQELETLASNQTWILAPRPNDRKVIHCKWVYHLKLGPAGDTVRYKARLVAKGFSQIQGQDYDETFSPVSRYKSIRLLLALIATYPNHNWTCHHSDVKSAFLNGKLTTTICMEQLEGMASYNNKLVCKLSKCLHGLKQASHEWYTKLSSTLIADGFQMSNFDPCVFIHFSGEAIITEYVDDLLIFSCSLDLSTKINKSLESVFE
jgi:hypothetical protein